MNTEDLFNTKRALNHFLHMFTNAFVFLHAVFAWEQESRHDKEKSEKKRDSTGAKEEKKQYPLMP